MEKVDKNYKIRKNQILKISIVHNSKNHNGFRQDGIFKNKKIYYCII
jgi:hypothetical protein